MTSLDHIARQASGRPWYRQLRRPPVRFVVLTPGRSGSTLLMDLLGAHPEVMCDFELLAQPRRNPDRTLALYAHRAARRGAYCWGWSLHPAHMLIQPIDEPVSWVEHLHDEGTRLISLRRRNPVHQALSALLGTGIGRSHLSPGATPESHRIDPREVIRGIIRAEEQIYEVERLVGERSHLSLVYEDDLEDPEIQQATVDRVFAFLGLEPAPVRATVAKRTRSFRDQLSNYDEVAEALATTRHAASLPE